MYNYHIEKDSTILVKISGLSDLYILNINGANIKTMGPEPQYLQNF